MNDTTEMKYIKKNITKEWLQTNNFRYNKFFSDEDNEIYTYRFPVYKYGDFITLECEFSVTLQNGEIKVNVYDKNTRNKYAPFYYVNYGNYDTILDKINAKIEKELYKLSIERINNESKDKKVK